MPPLPASMAESPRPWALTTTWVDRGPVRTLTGLLGGATLLALWVAATAEVKEGPQLLVPPGQVIEAIRELAISGELAAHLQASLGRLALGFGVGGGLGLLFGLGIGASRTLDELLSPSFHAVRQIPSIAFIPMLVLMFGVEETFKIVVVAKSTFFPIALATAEGVRGVPRSQHEVARVLELRPWQLARHIVLPSIVPPVVTGVRVALGRSWMVLVAAEIIAAEAGLGQMMEHGRQMFRIDVVLVGVLVTSLAGILIERGMRRLERRLAPWRQP